METPQQIIAKICKKYGLRQDLVLSKCHSAYVLTCRKEIINELRTLGLSAPEIGRFLNRHHTSILNLIHGWKKNGKPLPRKNA